MNPRLFGSTKLAEEKKSEQNLYLDITLTTESTKFNNPVLKKMFERDQKYFSGNGIKAYVPMIDNEGIVSSLTPIHTLRADITDIIKNEITQKNPAIIDDDLENAAEEARSALQPSPILPETKRAYTYVILRGIEGKPELRVIPGGGHWFLAGKAKSVLAAGEMFFGSTGGELKIISVTDNSGAYHIDASLPLSEKISLQHSFIAALAAVGLPTDHRLSFQMDYRELSQHRNTP